MRANLRKSEKDQQPRQQGWRRKVWLPAELKGSRPTGEELEAELQLVQKENLELGDGE